MPIRRVVLIVLADVQVGIVCSRVALETEHSQRSKSGLTPAGCRARFASPSAEINRRSLHHLLDLGATPGKHHRIADRRKHRQRTRSDRHARTGPVPRNAQCCSSNLTSAPIAGHNPAELSFREIALDGQWLRSQLTGGAVQPSAGLRWSGGQLDRQVLPSLLLRHQQDRPEECRKQEVRGQVRV